MKKIILSLLISVLLYSAGYAAPCYGTRMPEKNRFFIGLQTFAVLKRPLEKDYGRIKSLQNFLLLSYGIFDWLSLDLKGGEGNIYHQPGTGDEIKYPSFFAGGYGLRFRVYDHEKTKVILGFQHISVHPYSVRVGEIKNKEVLDDWQFSLLLGHQFRIFSPYLGPRWEMMEEIHWVGHSRKVNKSDKVAGLIIGTDVSLGEKIWLNLEGQFADGTALSGSINFAF